MPGTGVLESGAVLTALGWAWFVGSTWWDSGGKERRDFLLSFCSFFAHNAFAPFPRLLEQLSLSFGADLRCAKGLFSLSFGADLRCKYGLFPEQVARWQTEGRPQRCFRFRGRTFTNTLPFACDFWGFYEQGCL